VDVTTRVSRMFCGGRNPCEVAWAVHVTKIRVTELVFLDSPRISETGRLRSDLKNNLTGITSGIEQFSLDCEKSLPFNFIGLYTLAALCHPIRS